MPRREDPWAQYQQQWDTENSKVGAPFGSTGKVRVAPDLPFLHAGLQAAGPGKNISLRPHYVETEKRQHMDLRAKIEPVIRYPLGVPPRRPQPVPASYDTGRNYDREADEGW